MGWYGFQYIYPEYDFYLNNPNVIMYHCHNLLLNILAELGWHGLVVFVLVLAFFAWHAYKLARFGVRPWLRAVGQGYLAALIGILAGGLTDHVYFNMDMGLLFWCVSMVMMQENCFTYGYRQVTIKSELKSENFKFLWRQR